MFVPLVSTLCGSIRIYSCQSVWFSTLLSWSKDYLEVKFFVKCSRSLWSVKIKVGASTDPSSNVQVSEALTIANNLSQILHNYTLQESFFIDIKATGPRIPALSYWESTAAVTKFEASVPRIVWRCGPKWASIVSYLNACFILMKEDSQILLQVNGTSFLVKLVNGAANRENSGINLR